MFCLLKKKINIIRLLKCYVIGKLTLFPFQVNLYIIWLIYLIYLLTSSPPPTTTTHLDRYNQIKRSIKSPHKLRFEATRGTHSGTQITIRLNLMNILVFVCCVAVSSTEHLAVILILMVYCVYKTHPQRWDRGIF